MPSLPATQKRVMLTGTILLVSLFSAVTVTVSQETQTQIKKEPAPVVSAADGKKCITPTVRLAMERQARETVQPPSR